MISSTLNQYKNSFKANLLTFLNEYEDNTKAFFLQNEKTKYQTYQNALTKIADQMKFFTREELNQNLVHRSIASDLKRIDLNIYNSIITELNPVQDETILSLSAAKKDRIKIDETALENHIKSSIVILKFIADEFDVPFDLKEKSLSKMSEHNPDVIDQDLDTWLKANDDKIDYFTFPMMIEEKKEYVIDSFKNYEERKLRNQIAICNSILIKHQNEETVINFKRKFEKELIELRKQFPIPSVNIETIISDINNAFFRLEKFMQGSVSVYQSFLFNDAFTLFFNELNKVENVNARNLKLRDSYLNLLCDIDYAFDKSELKNQVAYQNKDFLRDCNEIGYLHFHRATEFGIDAYDYQFKIPSITEIVKNASNETIEQKINPVLEITNSAKKELKNNNQTLSRGLIEKLDFNLENLINLGATPEVIKYSFEQWVTSNEDILIDFKNNKIYAGIINAKKEMADTLEKIAISMTNDGMSQDQVEEFFKSEKEKSIVLFKEKCDLIPDDLVYDFNLKLILKSFERYEELKEKHFDSMVDEILKVDISNILIKNENLLSEKKVETFEERQKENINPYPKIFKNYKAFTIFEKLHAEFGNTKENLSNYSFVFHKMTYEDLIHNDIKQKSYYDFLGEFNISIDRIKSLADIGKIAYRESIYTKAKA